MIKKCGNCIHKDICEWGTDDPNKMLNAQTGKL